MASRWGKGLVVFLLLGVIINIAVAWGVVLWGRNPVMSQTWREAPWPAPVPRDWASVAHVMEGDCWGLTSFRAVGEADRRVAPPPHYLLTGEQYGFTAGVPFRAMRRSAILIDKRQIPNGWRQGILLPKELEWLALRQRRYLPLEPVWPGFAVNTVFFAAVLAMAFAGLANLRRAWRIRRGLCQACAYPVGTSDVCTECGEPVVANSPARQAAILQQRLPHSGQMPE